MISQIPVYNLSAVLRETGLKADVLRAWEKRYDLPRPQRSQGGHRLYSQYDIETVKWLHARQAEGLTISRAVDLWRELLAAGRDPLAEFAASAFPLINPDGSDNRIEMLRKEWLDACVAYDVERAGQTLTQAFALYPVETVCTEVLQRGLNSIGASWYAGSATVQQEHFVSALAIRRVEALIQAAPLPTREQTVLIGCPAGELHTFPALLIDLFLRRRGWRVIYLGADVPVDQLVETAQAVRPNVIVLAAQRLTSAAALKIVAQQLQPLCIPLAFGGQIFLQVPGLRERIAGWFAGETIDQAVTQIEKLALSPALPSGDFLFGDEALEAARLYREKRPLIEIALYDQLPDPIRNLDQIQEVIAHFGDGLAAALEFGNPAYIETDLDWVNWLLSGRNINPDYLARFLEAYLLAVEQVVGDQNTVIARWLKTYLSSR